MQQASQVSDVCRHRVDEGFVSCEMGGKDSKLVQSLCGVLCRSSFVSILRFPYLLH